MAILSSIGSFFLDILETVVVSSLIFVVVYVFIAQPFQVKGDSMKPNLHDGEYLLVSKLSYRFGHPARGDIIVFEYPNAPQYDYVKRIIGLPGETIEIKGDAVYINKKVLDEKYLAEEIITTGKSFLKEWVQFKIPEGEYFVMGDNRERSSDSRQWGTLPAKNIIGKSWIRYWPLSAVEVIHQ